jgi:hypothetical protein
MNNVLGALMLAVPIWPVVAIVSAAVFYIRHRNRVEPGRRLPLIVYLLALVVCGGAAAFGGMTFGAQWACARPDGGNLCGLVGVFVTGPIAGTMAVVLVGLALSLVGE